MASQCTDCGSTEVERDEQQGQVYCTGCGRVLQNYILLAQQQFQETSAGGIAAVGQHVGEGRDFSIHFNRYFLHIFLLITAEMLYKNK